MSQSINASRRAFVVGLSATTIYAADQLLRSSGGRSGSRAGLDLATVTPETFAAQQGTRFIFQFGWLDSLAVELVAVDKLSRKGKRPLGARTPFSVLFRGPSGFKLPQETYTVCHEQLGTFAMFLTPVGPRRDDRVMYEAVFA